MEKRNIIGDRLRHARKEKHLTQAQLSAKLELMGVNTERTMIAKIESGKRPVSDIEVAAIAKVLEVEVSWLYQGSEKYFD